VPMRYPSSVRRQVCLRLRSGEPVAEIAVDTGISPATLFRWKAQALIDAGANDGVPSVEADELATATWATSAPRRMRRSGTRSSPQLA
jgi:transposase-like protein